ncbi:MAG: hypothetical protein EHM68_16930 [Lysobacterales bacterium]|nr:MAG: hypothetical protein EHM68_16930 [Xanthomonadales bacterium]
MLMRVSALLQGWVAQAAEQLSPVTVWQHVCDHLKQIIAGVGPPKSLRLPGIMQTESGNYGF